MSLNKVNVHKTVRLLGASHTRFIVRMAQRQEKLEQAWVRDVSEVHDEIVEHILNQLKTNGKVKVSTAIFEKFLLSHYFHVVGLAVESAELETQLLIPIRLATKKPLIPKSLRELRVIYDNYRKRGRLPKGFRDKAIAIKKEYLKKTQNVWKKYSADFRNGDEFTQENVLRKVKKAADTVQSRAKTIVRTETTNYYNETRREIYDQSDAIWGYLFLAIRDKGTTKWCTDKVIEGKRGRHGLVYKKGDPLTDRESPSCHWNCRSEFAPLTMFNPRHRKLIENIKMHRRNHTCHALPKGWRS